MKKNHFFLFRLYGLAIALSSVLAFHPIMTPFTTSSTAMEKKEWTQTSVSNRFPLATFISLSVLVSSAHPSDAADITRGSEIFAGNCAGCHAGGMNFIKEKKTLKKDALEKYIASPLDQPTLQSWVMNSGQHKNLVFMRAPSGNGKLTEMDWNDVTSFVYENAMENKW
jgi:cytochrome c6